MKIKSYTKIFLHVLLWCIVLIIPLYITSRGSYVDYKHYYSFLIRTSVLIILFYINYLYLINKLLFNKKIWTYLGINILLVFVLLSVQTILNDMIMMPPHHLQHPDLPRRPGGPPHAMRIFSDYLMIVLIIGMSVAMKATMRWYNDSINLEKMKTVKLEADLKNLQNQLNPHFLFNTLNNIYSLIAIDTNKAQESVHRLSSLLRYVLYENDEKFVPIDKELTFTQNYIDLMKLRIRPNVKLNVLIENKNSQDMVASLMFMTLIENAFKHGINNVGENFIDIKILVEKEKGILCTVENSLGNIQGKEIRNNTQGIGLANLSRRLNLLYPNKHEFIAKRRTNSFFALLRIDFSE